MKSTIWDNVFTIYHRYTDLQDTGEILHQGIHISGESPGLLLDVVDDSRVEDGADLGPGGHSRGRVRGRARERGWPLEAGAWPRLLLWTRAVNGTKDYNEKSPIRREY